MSPRRGPPVEHRIPTVGKVRPLVPEPSLFMGASQGGVANGPSTSAVKASKTIDRSVEEDLRLALTRQSDQLRQLQEQLNTLMRERSSENTSLLAQAKSSPEVGAANRSVAEMSTQTSLPSSPRKLLTFHAAEEEERLNDVSDRSEDISGGCVADVIRQASFNRLSSQVSRSERDGCGRSRQ